MGQLLYGATPTVIDFDDRTLAHVELVTLAKLRRNESFALNLDAADGSRSTIWLNSATEVQFRLTVGRHEINREWLDLLIDTANSSGGMRVLPEPATTKGDSPK
jgi:hypothetical protein